MEFNLEATQSTGRPRREVRITSLKALPYGDGRRLRLQVTTTPFIERPTLHVEVLSPSGETVGSLSIIESDAHDVELTVHLRGAVEPGLHRVRASLQYDDQPPQDSAETTLEVEAPSSYY